MKKHDCDNMVSVHFPNNEQSHASLSQFSFWFSGCLVIMGENEEIKILFICARNAFYKAFGLANESKSTFCRSFKFCSNQKLINQIPSGTTIQ